MKHKFYYLDILRLLAVSLVMFGHFVVVATFATSIPLIINDHATLPLISQNSWHLWKIESLFIHVFNSQTAIIGVLIFFMVTGYLIAGMLDRYSRNTFIINRIFRIFPALIASTIIIGFFVSSTQGIKFTTSNYLASITLSYLFLGILPINGVLWTLIIEMLFYFIAYLIGKFTLPRLLSLQMLLFLIILYSVKNHNAYLNILAINLKYISFILVGTAIYLSEKIGNLYKKVGLVLFSFFLSYLNFKIYRLGHTDTTTYWHFSSLALSVSIFLCLYLSSATLFSKLPAPLFKLADLVYPIYLLHAPIGLGLIYFFKNYISSPYLLLIIAVTGTLLAAYVLHFSIEKPGIKLGKSLANFISNIKKISPTDLISTKNNISEV